MHEDVPSLDELKKERHPIANINTIRNNAASPLERMAIATTEHIGTMGFFFLLVGITVIWFLWNVLAPEAYRFDPGPAFVLWLFAANVTQLFLMPLIMIGQNEDAKHNEARAESDYATNLKAEREVEAILKHLENQNELLHAIMKQTTPKTRSAPRTNKAQ